MMLLEGFDHPLLSVDLVKIMKKYSKKYVMMLFEGFDHPPLSVVLVKTMKKYSKICYDAVGGL